jgi:hypothetical protein
MLARPARRAPGPGPGPGEAGPPDPPAAGMHRPRSGRRCGVAVRGTAGRRPRPLAGRTGRRSRWPAAAPRPVGGRVPPAARRGRAGWSTTAAIHDGEPAHRGLGVGGQARGAEKRPGNAERGGDDRGGQHVTTGRRVLRAGVSGARCARSAPGLRAGLIARSPALGPTAVPPAPASAIVQASGSVPGSWILLLRGWAAAAAIRAPLSGGPAWHGLASRQRPRLAPALGPGVFVTFGRVRVRHLARAGGAQ